MGVRNEAISIDVQPIEDFTLENFFLNELLVSFEIKSIRIAPNYYDRFSLDGTENYSIDFLFIILRMVGSDPIDEDVPKLVEDRK